MTPCPEYQPLLLDRAAGALSPESEARLAGHLETCLACRAESKALGEALSLAALPPVSEEERRALDGLAGETLRAFRRDRPHRALWRGLGAGIAIAGAAAAVVLLAPALRHGRTVRDPALANGAEPSVPTEPAAGRAVAWQEPDLDAVWEASGVIAGTGDDDSGSDEVAIFADYFDPDSL